MCWFVLADSQGTMADDEQAGYRWETEYEKTW